MWSTVAPALGAVHLQKFTLLRPSVVRSSTKRNALALLDVALDLGIAAEAFGLPCLRT